ncbi:MAG: O-methyltransferase [Gaiellaceae bacterium]
MQRCLEDDDEQRTYPFARFVVGRFGHVGDAARLEDDAVQPRVQHVVTFVDVDAARRVTARVQRRLIDAREQAPGLRLPYVLAPLQGRSRLLLLARLRALGVHGAGAYLPELAADGIHRHIDDAAAEYCELLPSNGPGGINPSAGAFLYALVRDLRPNTIVETGTASGISTTYLLAALARNGGGRLVSIDLPFVQVGGDELLRPVVPGSSISPGDSSPLPPSKEPGWAIPVALRDRWEVRLGDSRELLPALMNELGEIDIFFHDSLHTREHMLFEFQTAWPNLRRGGILAADDVFHRMHDALPVFARSVRRRFVVFTSIGFVKK